MSNKDKCLADTSVHILAVTKLINVIVTKLLERGVAHDASKLTSPELEIFTKYTPKLASLEYGSVEYNECLVEIKPALDHHYAMNRHHPAHYPDGLSGMTVIDLIEFMVDCKASCDRTKDGNILKSLEVNAKRFGMSKDLESILRNTYEMLEM